MADRDSNRRARRPAAATKVGRLLDEIDALIDADEGAAGQISGAWKTFDDIHAAANTHASDAYSIDVLATRKFLEEHASAATPLAAAAGEYMELADRMLQAGQALIRLDRCPPARVVWTRR